MNSESETDDIHHPIMMPAFLNPKNEMNNPIPTVMADFIDSGIASMIFLRRPVIVKMVKKIPEIKTAPNAVCQVKPCPITTVYVKKEIRPIPGATAAGKFDQKAKTMVAAKAASGGTPALAKMDGITMTI